MVERYYNNLNVLFRLALASVQGQRDLVPTRGKYTPKVISSMSLTDHVYQRRTTATPSQPSTSVYPERPKVYKVPFSVSVAGQGRLVAT